MCGSLATWAHRHNGHEPRGAGRRPPQKGRGAASAAPSLPPAAWPTPALPAPSNGRLLRGLGQGCGRLAANRCRPGNLRPDQSGHARDEHVAVATAWLGRLKGTSRMEIAIRQAGDLLASTEMKVCHLRIADRPAATALAQGLDRPALVEWDHQLLGRWCIGFRVAEIELAQGWVADGGEARLQQTPGRLRPSPRAVRLHARGGGTSRQAEAMHLADHRIARHAAEPAGDL